MRLLKIFSVATVLVLGGFAMSAKAQTPSGLELNGYGWSSNIGWISFNCHTGGASGEDICSDSNYQVRVNQNNGNLIGYAWSPNVGWIKFDTLTAFPTGGGTSANSARVTGNYPNFTLDGWMRACAGTDSMAPWCGNMNNSTVSGGWDGWVALKGTGYSINTNNFGTPQYAWGGDVVGWVDMSSRASWYTPASLSGIGCTISDGSSSCTGRLTWSIPGTYTNPRVVRTVPTSPSWSNTNSTGSNVAVTLPYGTNTFEARSNSTVIRTVSIAASCATGSTFTGGVCTPSASAVTLTITPDRRLVRRGETVSFRLTSVPDSPAYACQLNGGNTIQAINQVIPASGITVTSSAILNQTKFTLRCGSATAETVVEVIPTVNEI